MKANRRKALAKLAGMSAIPFIYTPSVMAKQNSQNTVKVAVLAPLTGPYALNGQMYRDGAQMAVDDINSMGGIHALGGRPMELVLYDCGDSVEKTRNAASRMLSDHPDLVGVTGCFLSSFTLAASEVTEGAKLPFLTLSYSDLITDRGLKYIFQTSITGDQQAYDLLPVMIDIYRRQNQDEPKRLALVMDNTASPVSTAKPLKAGLIDKYGLDLVVDEIYTPPLTDASALVQRVRRAKSDLFLLLVANAPDCTLFLNKMAEVGIGKGSLPTYSGGGHMSSPDVLKLISAENINGYFDYIANWTGPQLQDLKQRFGERYNLPWMSQDNLSTYGDIWILKTAVEKSESTDSEKVANAIRNFDGTEGLDKYYAGGTVQFDENGRRKDAALVVLQWQDGIAKSIYPFEEAEADVLAIK